MNVDIGKTYVVRIKDAQSADILHEYTTREKIIHDIKEISLNLLKGSILLISIIIPPLLFITIPLMKTKRVKWVFQVNMQLQI